MDKTIVILMFALAALPFSNILFLNLAGAMISAFEVFYIFIELILISIILFRLKIKKSSPFFIFISVIILYALISVGAYGASLRKYLDHLRDFLPFIVAVTLLISGISVNLRQYIKIITIASIISALSAFVIHYFFPGVIESSFEASPGVISITESGRMYWTNSFLLYFLVIFLFFRKELSRYWYYLLLLAVCLSFVAVFNTLNRTIIIGLLIISAGSIVVEKRFGGIIRRATVVLAGASVLGLLMFGIISIDERVGKLVESRYFGNGGGAEAIYQNSVLITRVVLYADYVKSIKKYFPLGQGLGRPYSTSLGKESYVTDISIASFVVPFGILGAIIFLSFIIALYRGVGKARSVISHRQFTMIKVLLFSSILVSLNIDLYSRNNFVIFVTILVLALPTVARKRTLQIGRAVSNRTSTGVQGSDDCV